jgi:hypothetical protein
MTGFVGRVRRHFCFKAKWSETEAKFVSIQAKRRNLKRNENETQRKWLKRSKNFHHFRFEAKGSETEANVFLLQCEKVFFRLFLYLKRNENEMKRKQN